MAQGLALAAGNWQGYDRSGPIYVGSTIRLDDIPDGASNTYLLGEKYLLPANYFTGCDGADNESMYAGCENDNNRSTYDSTPFQDRAGLLLYWTYGSAHANACCFALCDGSIHWISYAIDPQVHHNLGNRADGNTIDWSKL